jgi:RNA polymerase sigma-70 factor (ECF subfamily)
VSVTTITGETFIAPPAEADAGARLAARVSAGDVAAEGELVSRYERGVMLVLQRITPDRELCRDLCQETFVVVLRRLRATPLEDPSRLAGFIAQTARNLAIAEKRRYVRRRTDADSEAIDEISDSAPSREDESEAQSAANAVRMMLQQLKSPRDRSAIARYYLDEENKEAICSDLGLNERQLNVILFRARDRLRQLLEERGFRKTDLLSCLAF